MKKKLVVFSGAGVSAESGLQTFRDSDGLWENYNVMDVATPEAWQKDPGLVLEFYNKRRIQTLQAQPNAAHLGIAQLEDHFDVTVITQNIDNLHEKAGSKDVLHLHGEITKVRSSTDASLVYEWENELILEGDQCEKGSQLRPHIVWFGEAVPNMPAAEKVVSTADILIIVGTSLNVYPAASLIYHAPSRAPKYLIDPGDLHVTDVENLEIVKEKATTGIPTVAQKILTLID